MWDREHRQRLPRYVWITPAGWQMLGVDMVKLHEQQQKRLRESEIRQQLIREGVLREDEDISVHASQKTLVSAAQPGCPEEAPRKSRSQQACQPPEEITC